MIVQSIAFDKKLWTKAAARSWLKKHKYKYGTLDETAGFLHYQQARPAGKRVTYRTKMSSAGIRFVFMI